MPHGRGTPQMKGMPQCHRYMRRIHMRRMPQNNRISMNIVNIEVTLLSLYIGSGIWRYIARSCRSSSSTWRTARSTCSLARLIFRCTMKSAGKPSKK